MPGHEITVDEQQSLSVDGLLPSTVMRPEDAEDAARGLHLCDVAPAAVVVWGGGTQMRLGAPPRRYDVAFSTERMARLLEYEPADLTCRVEAGMRIGDLQATLRALGQVPAPPMDDLRKATERRGLRAAVPVSYRECRSRPSVFPQLSRTRSAAAVKFRPQHHDSADMLGGA